MIRKLNKYKQIDIGRKYNNDIGGNVKNKIEFFCVINSLFLWRIVKRMVIFLKKYINH